MFQSTRPARGATRAGFLYVSFLMFQSTRPARGATTSPVPFCSRRCFNPRAPRGARPNNGDGCRFNSVFQSTRPARGATLRHRRTAACSAVSIHAPRAGRDLSSPLFAAIICKFQSTRPARGATHPEHQHRSPRYVSIHAPRAGRDALFCPSRNICTGFNPRAPRGARPGIEVHDEAGLMFQSTRPARGATTDGSRANRVG